jgi:hypothetical protein
MTTYQIKLIHTSWKRNIGVYFSESLKSDTVIAYFLSSWVKSDWMRKCLKDVHFVFTTYIVSYKKDLSHLLNYTVEISVLFQESSAC